MNTISHSLRKFWEVIHVQEKNDDVKKWYSKKRIHSLKLRYQLNQFLREDEGNYKMNCSSQMKTSARTGSLVQSIWVNKGLYAKGLKTNMAIDKANCTIKFINNPQIKWNNGFLELG